jgi:hypothetical protein
MDIRALAVDRRQVLKGAGALMGAGGALAALGAPTTALAAGENEDNKNTLTGSWVETLDAGGGFVFNALVTYSPGGGVVATASIDSTKGSLSSPSQGAWKGTGNRHFRLNALAFSFDDVDGSENGVYHIEESVTLSADGNSTAGTGSFRIDPVGSKGITLPKTNYKSSAVRITA